jgi:hypothetical protein
MGRGVEGEGDVRAALAARLAERRSSVERGIFARVRAVPGPPGQEDAEYVDGLRNAVSASVGYALAGLEGGAEAMPPVPAALVAQARAAARAGVPLDVALRRCFAGCILFGDFLLEAIGEAGAQPGDRLGEVVQSQVALFEPLAVAVVNEHSHERRERRRSPEQRRVGQVRQLLSGEPIDTEELSYDFDEWHIGAIARGDGAASALRGLAREADRQLLLVRPDRESAWAWFGGRRRIPSAELGGRAPWPWPAGVQVALGEPARGIEGWRLTHQQASAALRIAQPGTHGVVQYADVSLLASISQDQVLARSLRQLYLVPLADGRDGGAALRKTLRAYFSAGRNISSAASALGLSRQTVRSRLQAIEEKLGRTLDSCAPEIEVALRLESIGGASGA